MKNKTEKPFNLRSCSLNYKANCGKIKILTFENINKKLFPTAILASMAGFDFLRSKPPKFAWYFSLLLS